MSVLADDDLASDGVADSPTRVRGLFVRGPLPWAWVTACARLPGRALHVGLALWLESGLSRSWIVKLRPKHLRALGVDRHAARRALVLLEAALLVRVVRMPGRAPVVEILKVEATAS